MKNIIPILLVLGWFALSPALQAGGPSRPSPTPSPTPTDVNVVNPTNSPVPVRDVDTAARTPFFANIQFFAGPGEIYKSASVDIPAGKMLVVEFTSAFASAFADGEDALVQLSIADGASGNTHFLVWNLPVGCTPGPYCAAYTASEQIRMYATSSIVMGIIRGTAYGETDVTGSITGYLVDAP